MIVRRKSDKTYTAFKVNDDNLPALLRHIGDTVRVDSLNGEITLAWGRGGYDPALIVKDPVSGEMVHYRHFAEDGQYVLLHGADAEVVDPVTFDAVYEALPFDVPAVERDPFNVVVGSDGDWTDSAAI